MSQKIFLPPLDSRWRLLGDFVPDSTFAKGDNAETMTGDSWSSMWAAAMKEPSVGSPPPHGIAEYNDWNKRFNEFQQTRAAAYGFDGTIPAGTILQIERYHVSRSGTNQITTKVLISPSKFLTPKKQKGLMRGAGRLYFSLDQFNTLPEIEPVTENLS